MGECLFAVGLLFLPAYGIETDVVWMGLRFLTPMLLSVGIITANRRTVWPSWLLGVVFALVSVSALWGHAPTFIVGYVGALLLVAALAWGSTLGRYPHAMTPLLRRPTVGGALLSVGMGLLAGSLVGVRSGSGGGGGRPRGGPRTGGRRSSGRAS